MTSLTLFLCLVGLVDANVLLTAAAIFGGNNRRDQPPPPPPPRSSNDDNAFQHQQIFPSGDRNHTAAALTTNDRQQHGSATAFSQQPPPPPNTGAVLMYPQYQHQPMTQNSAAGGWNAPSNLQQQQQQKPPRPPQHPQWTTRPDPAMFRFEALQRDLDDAMHRERDLLAELRNRSTAVADLEQRERLHIHQLDVLTERVLTVEHMAAQERNEHVELQANCTALAERLAETESELEEWKVKCNGLMDLKQKNEKRMQEWKHKWKSAAKEAEDLAIRIEEHHIGDGYERKRKKKKRSFLAWLFGFGKEDMEETDDDDYDALRERARTNLLTALRTERKAVGELEAVVAALQQNNTAIAEQVKSRDRIIQELNDRVAVFEEDKVVLKAALKQLQKEMSDETPKLEDALKDIDRLTSQIKKLQADHKKEISAMKKVLQQKQSKLANAETNLTTIGTYVDKLEERLADFTVAKRDIEKREAASKVADARIKKAEIAKEKLLQRVAELEEEQKELNANLETLVSERSALHNSTVILTAERNEIHSALEKARDAYANLDDETKKLRSANDQWAIRSEELERQLNGTLESHKLTQEQLNSAELRLTELQSQINSAVMSRDENDQALADANSMQNSLKKRISELEAGIQESAAQQAKVVESLQQKLEAEVRQNIVGRDERAVLVKKLEQLATQLKQIEGEKQSALKQVEKLKEQQPKPVERIEAPACSPQKTTASNQPKLNARPPGAPIPQETPPYRPRSADAPKRAFGKGVVNPQDAGVPMTAENPELANATIVESEPIPINDNELFAVKNATKTQAKLKQASNITNTAAARKVPLRGFRKFLSKRTGLHGVITRPSSATAGQKRKRQDSTTTIEKQRNTTKTVTSTNQSTQLEPRTNDEVTETSPKQRQTLSNHQSPHR